MPPRVPLFFNVYPMSTQNAPFLWLDGRKLSIFHFVWFVNKPVERGLLNFRQAFPLLVFLLTLGVKTKGMAKTTTSILLGVFTTDGKMCPYLPFCRAGSLPAQMGAEGRAWESRHCSYMLPAFAHWNYSFCGVQLERGPLAASPSACTFAAIRTLPGTSWVDYHFLPSNNEKRKCKFPV